MSQGKVRITILVENTAKGARLLAEHGLAYWIDYGGYHILFDTGQGYVLRHNAAELGIEPASAKALVLSHGHYDHTGGVAEVLSIARQIDVYAHPAALQAKFMRRSDGTVRAIGIPEAALRALSRDGVFFHEVRQPTAIVPGVMATGPIPRVTPYELPNPHFFLDDSCRTPDLLEDDQAVYITTRHGLVVLLACAHAGVINTIRYIKHLVPDRPIYALIGGMHLADASQERIRETLAELKKQAMELIAPAHCTGMPTTVAICQTFAKRYCEACVATHWEFDISA
ncbi:MAG: MBL fold metallo-hydrolase [Thermogutta sp.]